MSSSEKIKKVQPEGIGTRLRGLRQATNLSVRKFAKRFGFSYSLWSDYENDRRKPNATTMEKLCDVFAVSSDWIIFGTAARNLKTAEAEREGHRYVSNEIDKEVGRAISKREKRRKKKATRAFSAGGIKGN